MLPQYSMISNTNSTQLATCFTDLMKNKKCGHTLNEGRAAPTRKSHITPIPTKHLPTSLISVDIQKEPDRIILLCKSTWDVGTLNLNPSATDIPHNLQNKFDLLPASLQRICGHLIFPPDDGVHLAQAAIEGHLLGVSDGLLKNDRATHAWTLTTGPTEQLSICSCGPIDRTASTLSSFCTELQGQVALLIMVTLLMKVHSLSNSSYTSVCDNQGTLKHLRPSQTGLCLHHHKRPDADLILTFCQWSDNNIHQTSKWIQGRQDHKKVNEDLSDEEQLNIEMDALAAIAYDLPYELQM